MAIKRHTDGKRWQVDYYTPDGKRKRPIFGTKSEAKAFEADMESRKRGGIYVDPSKAKGVTVDSLYALWTKRLQTKGARGTRPVSPDTLKTYDVIFRCWVRPHWEYRPLASITRAEVEEWLATLRMADGSPGTDSAKSKALKQLSRMLDFAVSEGILSFNPARDRAGRVIPTPTVTPSRTQVRLTMRQLVRLADATGEYRLFVLFTGLTGLRWGEATTIRRKHLDFGERPTVAVEAGVAKNNEARIVPIPSHVAELLEAKTQTLEAEAYAFASPRGNRLNKSNFSNRIYADAGERAGNAVAALHARLAITGESRRIQDGTGFRLVALYGERTEAAVKAFQTTEGLEVTGVVTRPVWAALGLTVYSPMTLGLGDSDFIPPTFHNLRHTAVSLAISAGANIKVVQRIAGHKSATMTLDVYGDLFEDDLNESAARLDVQLREVLGLGSGAAIAQSLDAVA
ncbi:tyrosine-type recombinase/integrase [Glutamicibacter sp. MNS18]|uniref:tyrosine-type recombinase/integrase n=1 Tax=Glutamicibacter sp. MNS18 TaxID=2989817 RepID=UPI002235CDB9|nr:tyrosine-type recombinase/integrase [Glutamicibacter sp. MNS18]MCW4464631.1 tyrosine-type recombinase/integrase [Glutamicibacter sp. MNS18]